MPSRPTSRQAYTAAEPPWHFTSLIELRQGFHGLGATRDCGPTGSTASVPATCRRAGSTATPTRPSSATPVMASSARPKLTLALGARAQYAWKPLLSFEEFSAGNYTVGRGYDPGRAAWRHGLRNPGRDPLRQPHPDQREQARGRGLCLLGPCDGPQPRQAPASSARPSQFGRRAERASIGTASSSMPELAVPLTHVGPFNSRPDPRVLDLAHYPLVALEILMSTVAYPPFRPCDTSS